MVRNDTEKNEPYDAILHAHKDKVGLHKVDHHSIGQSLVIYSRVGHSPGFGLPSVAILQ